jgi:hypothetical protein
MTESRDKLLIYPGYRCSFKALVLGSSPSRPTSTDFPGRPLTSGIPEEKQVTPGKLIESSDSASGDVRGYSRTAGRFLGPVSGPFEKLQKRGPQSSRICRENGCPRDFARPIIAAGSSPDRATKSDQALC